LLIASNGADFPGSNRLYMKTVTVLVHL
jgi:hypothetical protein